MILKLNIIKKHSKKIHKMTFNKRTRQNSKQINKKCNKQRGDFTEIIYGKNACCGCFNGYANGIYNREIYGIYILQSRFDEYYKQVPTELRKFVKQCNSHDMFVLTHEQDKHQGIAVKASAFKFLTIEELIEKLEEKKDKNKNSKSSIFVLDCVQDPQNVGNIIRTAFCFGVDAIILTSHNTCGITSSVVRASAGYSECSLMCQVNNLVNDLSKLKQLGYWIIGFDVNTNTTDNLPLLVEKYDKCIFIFGSEGQGMKDLTKKTCDIIIKLPMAQGAESLNVANTATIVGWEIMKNKQQK